MTTSDFTACCLPIWSRPAGDVVADQDRTWRSKLAGHDLNAIAAQVLASRDYLFGASGQRADTLSGVGTSPL